MSDSLRQLELLRRGQPPDDPRWLEALTLGRQLWLDRFREHYLERHAPNGGSKIKILTGSEGSGKSHLLRCVASDARSLGYLVVFLNLRDQQWRLSSIVDLYRAIARQVDFGDLVAGLCRRVAEALGYGPDEYDGSGSIIPLLEVSEHLPATRARRELRKAAAETLRAGDLSLPFSTLAYTVVSARMDSEPPGTMEICRKWLSGEPLSLPERRRSRLYDKLSRMNGRVWLYSLIRLMRFSGKTGVVILVDDLEAILERSFQTRRFRYSPSAAKDTYELIRQLIDDVDFLEHFVLLLSGRNEVLSDEYRGFASYEALWMRLQSGLVPSGHFNPFADIVNVDSHLEAAGGAEFARQVGARLQLWLEDQGIKRRYRPISPQAFASELRRIVMETALLTQADGEV